MLFEMFTWLAACLVLGTALRAAQAALSPDIKTETYRQNFVAAAKYAGVVAAVSIVAALSYAAVVALTSRPARIPKLAGRPLYQRPVNPVASDVQVAPVVAARLPDVTELKRRMIEAVTDRPVPAIVTAI